MSILFMRRYIANTLNTKTPKNKVQYGRFKEGGNFKGYKVRGIFSKGEKAGKSWKKTMHVYEDLGTEKSS